MQYDSEHTLSFQSILRHTVPLLHCHNKGLKLGSGVLVDIGDRSFVATAFHCIGDAIGNAVVMTDGVGIPNDGSLPSSPVPILAQGGDKRLDIGFLEIPRGAVIRTAYEHEACALGQLYIGPTPSSGNLHLCGWPQYGFEYPDPTTLLQSLEGLIVQLTGFDTERLRFKFSGEACKRDDRGQWIRKATPSPHGFSGGGCWAITKAGESELYAPSKTTRLLAIQTHWNTIDECTATLIGEWVRIIDQHYPDLQAVLRSGLRLDSDDGRA